jgi:endoglucanase
VPFRNGIRAPCATVWMVCGLAVVACATAGVAAAAPNLRVRGTQLIDGPGRGHILQLRGVNRSGLEYACIQGWGFFDSPHPNRIDDPKMIAAMKRWDIDVVRVPLNEDCWLGINTPHRRGGKPYRAIVRKYVRALHAAHLYVILDLQVAAPGRVQARYLVRLPDRDHAPAFWRSVASTFKGDHAVLFDLYNEPNHVGWGCWQHGCRIPAHDDGYGRQASYRAVGMQQLVDAVRSTGATQPLLVAGISYAHNLDGWIAHEPHDPRHQLIASEHNYGVLSPCEEACQAAVLATDRYVPVLFGELGETDCEDSYVDQMMRFADTHEIGYLGWAWDAVAPTSWTCAGGPSLITDYGGTPTKFGVGMRDHFQALGVALRPS